MLEFWLVVGCVMAIGLTILLPVSIGLGWLLTHEPPMLFGGQANEDIV